MTKYFDSLISAQEEMKNLYLEKLNTFIEKKSISHTLETLAAHVVDDAQVITYDWHIVSATSPDMYIVDYLCLCSHYTDDHTISVHMSLEEARQELIKKYDDLIFKLKQRNEKFSTLGDKLTDEFLYISTEYVDCELTLFNTKIENVDLKC